MLTSNIHDIFSLFNLQGSYLLYTILLFSIKPLTDKRKGGLGYV